MATTRERPRRCTTKCGGPAVIEHPVTGRPILFVNPMHTHGFVGMEREEAWPLIEELAEHATQDRFVYYHRWRVGDVLMWDERATMHRGAGDYRPDERRIMLRTIVYAKAGNQPLELGTLACLKRQGARYCVADSAANSIAG